MKYDNFEFAVIKVNCDKFKLKPMMMLRNTIEGGRLVNDITFHSYANIEFDKKDINHIHPIIEETDAYNRVKTNCLVYDMLDTEANNGRYDKLFIYQTNGIKTDGFFGWLMYNTITRKYSHKYYIDRDGTELCHKLHEMFNHFRFMNKNGHIYDDIL